MINTDTKRYGHYDKATELHKQIKGNNRMVKKKTNRWMDGWMDGRTDGDRQTDR